MSGSSQWKDTMYSRLPVALQNIACSWYGLKTHRQRFNANFESNLASLVKSEWYSKSDIESFQDEKVRELIKYVYDYVPYYGEIMRKMKLTPADIKCKKDLVKLPILTKEDVRQNRDKLLSVQADRTQMMFSHTSGTTGKSLQFYVSRKQIPFQWAVWWRHRKRFNVDPGTLHANFTGKLAIPLDQKKPPYWRWNMPLNQAVLTMHHLHEKNIHSIVQFLNNHEFNYYSGYPSIIYSLCALGFENGIKLLKPPKLIFPGAENTLDYQRKAIADYTNATITDQYGFSEGCGNASQCEEFKYHEDFEFGVLECCEPEELADGRTRGKIVCTGFACPEFPFIRYQVGDTAIWEAPDKQCECGRHSAMLSEIEGRMDDFVITPEGRRIMRFDYLFKDTLNVKECQVLQYVEGQITIKIVRRASYSAKDEGLIMSEVHKWISSKLHVNFDYVDTIEREPNGKFRAVKSSLNSNKFLGNAR